MPPLSPFSPDLGLATPVMSRRGLPPIGGPGNILTERPFIMGGGTGGGIGLGMLRGKSISKPFKLTPAERAAAVRERFGASQLKAQERAQNLKDMKAFQRVKSPQSEQIRQQLGREGLVLRPAQGGTTQPGVRGIEVVKQGKGSIGQIILTGDKFFVGQRGKLTGEFKTFNEAMQAFLKK